MAKITATEIKKNNRNSIYSAIYQARHISKQHLAQTLGLSLPTITKNLKELEELGLIQKDGFYSSTSAGGRKAQIISCNRRARIAIGVEILKHHVHIAAADLYGTLLAQRSLDIPFECSPLYYIAIGSWINDFVNGLNLPKESILGVNIAIQGLISPDQREVTYGEILNCTGLTIDAFSQYINYPCIFSHDAEAGVYTEIWSQPTPADAFYLLINMTVGGALILNGKIFTSQQGIASTPEHMCLYPDGKKCYCGKQGCAEMYCSLQALLDASDSDTLDEFFSKYENQDPHYRDLWHNYLRDLARLINNILRLVDCDIVLSGLISTFLDEEDITLLQQFISEFNSFSFRSPHIRLGVTSRNATVMGAAYYLIKDFLEHDPIFQ